MQQYQDLLTKILQEGTKKPPAREGMPSTIGISHGSMTFDLRNGFPLVTTKKMFLKGVIHELLWFLRGDTNIKYLVDNKVNIWNKDAYKWYSRLCKEHCPNNGPMSYEGFVASIEVGDLAAWEGMPAGYRLGDLGKVYGHQWRNQNGVDQIKDVIESLQSNPFSRYHIIDGWNKADFKDMALPPCHLLYQFTARPSYDGGGNYLDLNMYQRSCDTFLGVPFNIASPALLLMIMARVSGMRPGVFEWLGGDTHVYENHLDQINEQLERDPYPLPTMTIVEKQLNDLDDIMALHIDDFVLTNYEHHPAIKAELSVGK